VHFWFEHLFGQRPPGEVRTSQNWIGATLASAVFVPPHHSELPELLSNLEKYWHQQESSTPHLIKAAVSHYQFETIHPFLDGNGRIGRLLIPLYLVANGILTQPTLYLSDFFERNRGHYYDSLTAVRTQNDLDQWLRFFLAGVAETAEGGAQTFEKIVKLRQSCEIKLLNMGRRAKLGGDLLTFLYARPKVSPSRIKEHLKISHQAAANLIEAFQNEGILKEVTGYRRNRLYAFAKYIELFR
jgi:Fic family protein